MESIDGGRLTARMTNSTASCDQRPTTLVLGSTGKTGRRVLERLRVLDVPVRPGSRTGEPPFDWADRTTWTAALGGVESVYVSYYPDLATPGAPDDVAAFVRAATSAGVRQLVLLSGRGEPEAQRCEEIVRDSGVAWTILRSSWFAQNFSENFMRDELMATGSLALPVGDVREPFVDTDDIADAAVAALTGTGHDGRLYEVTGPRLLSFADAVEQIARASGRDFAFRYVSAEEYAAGMRELRIPHEVQAMLTYLFTEVLDGRNASVGAGLPEALGRPGRDFAEFAGAAASAGTWAA